jgi:putative flippase GtrA
MRALISQFARFGVIGLVGLGVDVAVFNLLRATILSPERLSDGPLLAKVISTSIAIVVNWLGNRYWTFRHQRRSHWVREAIEFALVSIGGLLIAVGCLWFSHYVLKFTSIIADNIATNVVGLALGTIFRFAFYRLWVFSNQADAPPAPPDVGIGEAVPPAGGTSVVRTTERADGPAGTAPNAVI